MILQRWLLATFWLVVICTLPCACKKPRAVTTLINARWNVTPLVFEVAEFLADEQIDYLWAFVESVNNIKSNKLEDLGTEKEVYNELLNQAGQFISPAKIQLLKLALSLHIYAPKIAMYKQVAEEQGIISAGCANIAIVGGITTCDPRKVAEIIDMMKHGSVGQKTFKLNVDHHYPGSANNSIIAVLYGQIGTQQFADLHRVLKQEALKGNVNYILRHYAQENFQDKPGRRVRLSGYGVELQLKSTEYKVQDDSEVKDGNVGVDDEDEEDLEGFNFQKLKQLYPDLQSQLNKFKLNLLDSSDELAPLKVWQFQALSLQAAAQIMKSPADEALHVMATIAQNFPQQARPLLRVKIDPEMKKEIKHNQDMFSSILNLQPQDTAIFINGMFFDLDVVDIISLLEVLREEHRTMQGLHTVGISDKQIKALMALDFSSWLSDSSDYALDIRDTSILWINNIVTDERFKRGSDSFRDLFQPIFSGHFRNIRRNLYNLVVIGDPSKKNVLDLLTGMIQLHENPARIPVRLGVVFAVNPDSSVSGLEDAGVAVLNAFNYVAEKSGPLAALSFVVNTYYTLVVPRDLEVEDVVRELNKKYSEATEKIFDVSSDYNTGRLLADDFLHRSGLRKFPQALMNGVPMENKFLNVDDFAGAVENEMHRQTPIYQKAFFRRELRDVDDEIDFIMSRPNVMPRLNSRILNVEESRQLDLSAVPARSFSVADLPETSSPNISALLVKHINYVSPPERPNKKSRHFITNWVVADLASEDKKGREVLQSALKHMESSGNVRVGFIPNIRNSSNSNLNYAVVAAFKSQPGRVVKAFLKKILESAEFSKEDISDDDLIGLNITDLDVPALRATLESEELKSAFAVFSEFSRRVVNVPVGHRAVISNGRVIGPLDTDEDFTEEDFSLLERHSMATHIDKIKEALDDVTSEGGSDISSDTAMKVINILLVKPQSRNRFQIPAHSTDHSVLTLKPQRDTEPAFFIDVIVDPVSRGAQKASSILLLLREVLNCYIRVFLNPVDKNSDMPVKSFYRFVAEPELQFAPDGSLSAGPIARFTNLPTTSLLTQNLQVPENWLVESVRSPYDLDNIRLDGVVGTVHSEYELEHLLLEGHCFEVITSNPPRGLQMTLGTETTPLMVDTIVMANLGYFQFKANPGAWVLRLRQGRSADLYDIVGHEGTDSTDGNDIKVVLSSFRSHVLKLRVQKKKDKMTQDLLADDDDGNSGLWSSLTNTFSGGSDAEESQEPINIFSLASGHLYERFLRIMMLSVLRHTKTPVKFWFLKNYLSPTFKDFLPHMAKEYGFQYQLVQYKWPRWLHQQTEKQRTIWGYKILFLDVLFPLDVKKIIFVDADQVVRADLKELRDFDLGGAPYGYTPFCDSRKEMDGFRFWKQGYWRSHLQGRRYHISALYVVDLKKFRRIAAGDRLRGQYQALSQDPNSLSNLDQDLPNNMIHQVQIKSLPQEWLWCETWCDDQSKKHAKTIDLCNNPMTKEAKLSAAMRILPEWKEYDEEIKKLQKKIIHEDLEESAEFVARERREEEKRNDASPTENGAELHPERDEL